MIREQSAKGEPAAKRKDAGVQFVVTRSEHTDCYKRGSTDTEVRACSCRCCCRSREGGSTQAHGVVFVL